MISRAHRLGSTFQQLSAGPANPAGRAGCCGQPSFRRVPAHTCVWLRGGLAAGYRIGKDATLTSFGGSSQPGNWGNQGASNGDGGDNEFATRGDLNEATQGLHDKIDGLAAGGQASGPDGGPGRNNAFSQGTGRTPAPQAAGTWGKPPPTMIDCAAARNSQPSYAQGLHEQMNNAEGQP